MNYSPVLLMILLGTNGMVIGFKLGVEAVPNDYGTQLRARGIHKVGLLTNQSGIDQQGRRTIDILRAKKVPLTCILAPEHGIAGTIKGEVAVNDGKDAKTGLIIKSLYGGGSGKKMDVEFIKSLDLVIFDIQDVGMRHYTYISTLLELLKAAAITGTEIVVLDRPNLLGNLMEGPLVEDHLISFISVAPIPLRYGLTIGELASYFNKYVLEKPAKLSIIPMAEYVHGQKISSLKVHLSPNIRTLHSCWYYSFLGLLSEIRPYDVGVATDLAFQCLLLPERLTVSETIWKRAADLLAQQGIHAIPHRYYSQRKKQFFTGLRFIGADHFPPQAFRLFAELVVLFKQAGVPLVISPSFEKAAGSSKVRQFVEGNDHPEKLIQIIRPDLEQFRERARSVLLYQPAKVVMNEKKPL